VDDDVDTREALADELGDDGHSILLALNGCHALELLELGRARGNAPCVALVDLTMPVMDGWALLAALDRDGSWRRLQVIVSSGTDLSERPLSFAHKIVVWPKPIDPDKLARIQDQCPLHALTPNSVAAADSAISSADAARNQARAVARETTEFLERLPREAHAQNQGQVHTLVKQTRTRARGRA
jgi:CheY-like chemotaxis protein